VFNEDYYLLYNLYLTELLAVYLLFLISCDIDCKSRKEC